MTLRSRRCAVVVVMTLLMTGGAASLIATFLAAAGVPTCSVVREWADAHEDQLPRDLDGFLAIPWSYRSGVWSRLSPEARANVMSETLRRAIASGRISAPQSRAIQTVLPYLTPAFYADADRLNAEKARLLDKARSNNVVPAFNWSDPHDQLAARLDGVLLAAFPHNDVTRRIVSPFTLPQRVPQRASLVVPFIRGIIDRMRTTVVNARGPGICQCRFGAGWAEETYDCEQHGLPCRENGYECADTTCITDHSCGATHSALCTGICQGL
jgi:hypothetical protein